jgi:biotin-dependent carboxylase-like uncharacterized protein
VAEPSPTLTIVRAGSLTTVQDFGRPGVAHLAVAPSGALDPEALRLANRLVGNPAGAAALETTLTGVALRAEVSCRVAVTGAVSPVTVDGSHVEWAMPVDLLPGQLLDVGMATVGVRAYVAVAGGLGGPSTFGSRSSDVLSGLGPRPLRDGDTLLTGRAAGPPDLVEFGGRFRPPPRLNLLLHLGPRHDWMGGGAVAMLRWASWRVAAASNRTALRLEGPSLTLRRIGQLPSEGVVTGAVQVPPDGRPLIFLADHPTTGGYPVVGVVDLANLGCCAQARPGTAVSFRTRRYSLPGTDAWQVRERR